MKFQVLVIFTFIVEVESVCYLLGRIGMKSAPLLSGL